MEEQTKSCCLELKKRLLRSEEKRVALRQGVKVLSSEVDKIQEENIQLKNELEKEKLQLKLEKEGKDRQVTLQEDLDKEINNLRMEISSLQKKDCFNNTDETRNRILETRVSEGEAEIKRLNQLLINEKKIYESQKKKFNLVNKEVEEAMKMLEIEKGRVEEGKRLTELERKRAKEYQDCVEKCKLEVIEAREKLSMERSEICHVRDQLEAERQNFIKEKKQADIERMNAEVAMQCTEANCKNANDEKTCSFFLPKQLECERKKLECERKKLECERKKLDHERKKFECLQKEMEGIISSNDMRDGCCLKIETHTIDDQRQKMELLREKLKFEKKKVRHSKEVIKLQETENNLLRRRFHLLKHEFLHLSKNLSLIGSQFSQNVEGIDVMAKIDSPSKPGQNNLNDGFGCKLYNYGSQGTNELSFNIANSSKDTTRECTGNLFPGLCGNIFYPVSGITSDLESPIRCSVRRKSQSSVACSNSASFSDRTLMGQEAQTMESNHRKKKRKIENALGSVKSMYSEAKKMRAMIGENLLMMINFNFEIKSLPILVSQSNELPNGSEWMPSGNLTDFDKNKWMESENDTNTVPAKTINGNGMKLQEIDGADEERLRVDLTRPLSPLPILNFPEFIGEDPHFIQREKENLSFLRTSRPDYTDTYNEETLIITGNHLVTDPELAGFVPNVILNQCGTGNGFWNQRSSMFCVICNSKDAGGVLKIFQAMGTIISQTSVVSQTTQSSYILEEILSAYSVCEDLSSMENVSVLFSLLLNYGSGQLSANPGCFFSGKDASSWSFEAELNAHSDLQTQFVDACKIDIDCLVTLMENFLHHKEIYTYKTCKDNLGTTVDHFSKENPHIYPENASLIHLVSGSMILASTCKLLKDISFLVKLSYQILRWTPRSDFSSVLAILHTFASVCGESFFSAAENKMSTIVKSVVQHLELGQSSSPHLESVENLPTCKDCPFSQGAMLLDELVLFLMSEMEHYPSSTSKLHSRKNECVGETLKNSGDGHTSCLIQIKRVAYEDCHNFWLRCGASCLRCSLIDDISLLELTMYYMDWHWTFENIIPSLFKMVQSFPAEEYSSIVITLFGIFGRMGVNAFGYEHDQVAELRKQICTLLDSSDDGNGNRMSKASLGLEVRVVEAMLKLLPLSFKEICGINFDIQADKSLPSCMCIQNIRKWFSQLNEIQKQRCMVYTNFIPKYWSCGWVRQSVFFAPVLTGDE